MKLPPRKVIEKSKELKSKIGIKRLAYVLEDCLLSGKPKKEQLIYIWEDELDTLVTNILGFDHTGYRNSVPIFTNTRLFRQLDLGF
jgi:hypothetical protein